MRVAITIVCFFALAYCKSPPKFADQFSISGVLFLPYAEIEEPFTAYYDAKSNKSRIDYYGDMMQVFQLANEGEYGTTKKIAYMSTDTVLNVRTCFQVNGTVNATMQSIQSVLPDMSNFKYHGIENCPVETVVTKICQVWRHRVVNGKKISTYTMWLEPTKDNHLTPVRYEMIGYDSLFGSHYDRYYLNYQEYNAKPGAVPDAVFAVNENLTCRGFPGPGVEATHLLNPMHEFINNDETHIHKAFGDFKDTHKKSYKNPVEHDKRKEIFKQNFRYIHSTNRQGNTYTVAVNHMTDLTNGELKTMRGKLPSTGYNGGESYEDVLEEMYMPKTLDWRYYGAVTPVKDQAVCGSCWSFGTTGTLEGALFLKTGTLVKLSQQQLMDCSWGEGNNACDGGEDYRAYEYIMKNGGLESDLTYGNYMGADGKCHHNKSLSVVHIQSFVNVTSGDLTALRSAVFKHGPISVGIDAAVKSFSFYSNGVYYDKKCGNKLDDLDHAVLAVGYGIIDGQAYWLVKNSWSTYWGNDGYVLISQRDNNCGVATQPSFPILT